MHRFYKGLKILGLIAVILIIGVIIGWLETRKTSSTVETLGTSVVSSSVSTDRVPFFSTNSRPRPPETAAKKPRSQVSSPGIELIPNWEDKLEDILGSDAVESAKARQLLAIFPRLPEDGQVEVAQHLSNLVADEDYTPLGKLLTDPKESEGVLDVLMVDVSNRPNALKLPLLLEIAREQEHPKAAEAKDLLELYLEEDYGTDWNKWQGKLEQWLKDNPD
jgi:hypothetical protein